MSYHPGILVKDMPFKVLSGAASYTVYDSETNSMQQTVKVRFSEDDLLREDDPTDWPEFVIKIDLNIDSATGNYELTGKATDQEKDSRLLNCYLGPGMTVTDNHPFMTFFPCKRPWFKLYFYSHQEAEEWMLAVKDIRNVAAHRHHIMHPV
jgi:hypothetical protein